MRTNLIALVALIGAGDPAALVDARKNVPGGNGGRPDFPPQGRGASQAALKSKGLSRAGVQNIDPKNVPCNPKSSCNIHIVDGDDEIDVQLEANSVRAPGFKLLVEGEDVTPPPEATYRGKVLGDAGSTVAASVTEAGVTMEIITSDGNKLVVEPVDADDAEFAYDHVVYDSEADVIPKPDKMCGAMALERRSLEEDEEEAEGGEGRRNLRNKLHLHPLHGHEAGGHHHHHHLRHPHEEQSTHKLDTSERKLSAHKVAEVAIEVDFEYYQRYGSVNAVVSRVESVINAVNVDVYESDVGITHVVPVISIWTGPNDPYSSTDPVNLLNQFRSFWYNNRRNEPRDVAHLFTGKELNQQVIGIAWLGVICQPWYGYGYGLSQVDFNNNFVYAVDLVAHELGHNWNADHCSCTSNTMNAYITGAKDFHPTFTVPEIVNFRNSRTCLDDAQAGPVCGDGTCDSGEDCCADCGCPNGETCDTGTNACVPNPVCGDGTCNGNENCGTCSNDCGCPSGESCVANSCAADPFCGDDTCNGNEDSASCCSDCGCPSGETCNGGTCVVPDPFCGDGSCNGSETSTSCCSDCGCPSGETCQGGACVAPAPEAACSSHWNGGDCKKAGCRWRQGRCS